VIAGGPLNSEGRYLDLSGLNMQAFASGNFTPVNAYNFGGPTFYQILQPTYPFTSWTTEQASGLPWLNGSSYQITNVFEAQQVVQFTVTPQTGTPFSIFGQVVSWDANDILFAGYLHFDPATGTLSGPMTDPTVSYTPSGFPNQNLFDLSYANLDYTPNNQIPGLTSVGAYTDDTGKVPFGLTVSTNIPCFMAGTRIMTPHGEVAVEALREGDEVLTVSGQAKRIVWIGKRLTDCSRHPEVEKILPVRIAAGAFGPDLPRRDLYLSPEHAVFAEGVMIPVRELVNGTSIVQERVRLALYFHIELETHDVVLAEGLPAETYLDTGNRRQLAQDGVVQLNPDFILGRESNLLAWEVAGYAPLKVVGPEVERVRGQLAERVALLADREQRAA
jgi:hypothetical protein